MSKIIVTPYRNGDPKLFENLHEGSLLNLQPQPDNPVDKNAVAVCLDDGTQVGFVGNRRGITVPDGFWTAATVAGRLARPTVAGARVRLLTTRNYGTPGVDDDGEIRYPQTHWEAEIYWLPCWDTAAGGADRELLLEVGPSRGTTGDLAGTIQSFPSLEKQCFVLRLLKYGKRSHVLVYRKEHLMDPEPASCGEVQNVTEDLLQVLETEPQLIADPLECLDDSRYRIRVVLGGTGLEEYYDDMERVVEACIMQVRDVRQRVQYMREQRVPARIIHGVLRTIAYNESGAVEIPNQVYLQSPDSDVLTRVLAYRISGRNIRLVGEKGAGKNTLVYTVCWLLNQSLYRLQGNADMDKVDLLGGMALNGDGTHFELSCFLQTLCRGGDVVVDEINSIKPEIALVIHSLVDDARAMDVPGYGRVEIHPRARVWATMNEGYVGTGEINAGTSDRFTPIHMGERVDLKWLLQERCPNASRNDIAICVAVYDRVWQAVRDGMCTPEAITTRGYIDALESTAWLPIRTTLLDNVAGRPQDEEYRTILSDFIQAVCG